MESCDDIDEECMRVLESCQDKFEDLNRKAVQVLEKEQRLNSFLDQMTSDLKLLNSESIYCQDQYL